VHRFDQSQSHGWTIVTSHVPGIEDSCLSICIVTELAALCGYAANKNVPLREIRVSDRWLQMVADAPNVSLPGLALVGTHLSENGYLTLFDALEWLSLEVRNANEGADNKVVEAGMLAVLRRAIDASGHLLDARLGKRGRRPRVYIVASTVGSQ